MSGPDFRDLVGDEGTPEEREQLRRAHDLLIAAGPPPELPPTLAEAPEIPSRPPRLPRRRRGAALVVAVGVAAAAFFVGFLLGDPGSGDFQEKYSLALHPPTGTGSARASILVGEHDSVGNYPLLVNATGLKKLPAKAWYSLYLTRNGKIAAWCGVFAAKGGGRVSVRMSVPYKLGKGVGWVVTTGRPNNRTVILTT